LIALGTGYFTRRGDAGLETQQIDDVAREERQLADLELGEGVTDRSVLGVDGWSFRNDVD